MSEQKLKIDSVVVVKPHTRAQDLKSGDLVVTAQIMEVKEVKRKDYIICTDVGEVHPFIKHVGWGQQGLMKVLAGAQKQ